MINLVKHFPLKYTNCCIELSDRRILVTGYCFIKVFSLDTYEEVQDIPSEVENFDSLVIPDKNIIFIATYGGLRQYSLPDFRLVSVYEPGSVGGCLAYLESKATILFND